jgi:hypothetical protein
MLSRAERTERMAVWLQRLQKCRESKQTLADLIGFDVWRQGHRELPIRRVG